MGNLEVKEVSKAPASDGTVAFQISVINRSTVQAKNGSVYIRICEKCEFAEEPQRFSKPLGAQSTDRQMNFQALDSTTALAVPLKIKPPALEHRFEIAVTTRCENCVVRPKELLHVDY
jgi:hypothetical protein